MRVIDAFNHILPARYYQELSRVLPDQNMAKRIGKVKLLHDIEGRMRMMDQWPGYQQLLTVCPPGLELLAGPEATPELARIANDGLAEICAKWPDKFPAFAAAVPCNNPDASLKEIDRAITQLGARGIQIFTNINGRPLDDPEFLPIFECIEIEVRGLAGPGLAARQHRGDGADGVFRAVRQISEPAGADAPSRRHGALSRRPARAAVGSARLADAGRGLRRR
jgi:hypothetical protein